MFAFFSTNISELMNFELSSIIKNVKNIQKCDDATAMDYIGIPPADQMKYTPWL